MRFEQAFPIILSSEIFGDFHAVARSVTASGILIEMSDPLPLGTEVQVYFQMQESQVSIVARGQVKNHYFLNFADGEGARQLTGMSVRFTQFEPGELPNQTPAELRMLH
jgi:putative heme iron utilization protein